MTTQPLKPTPGLLYFTWANGRGELLTAERVAELYLAKFGEPALEVIEWAGLWWGGPRPEPEALEAEVNALLDAASQEGIEAAAAAFDQAEAELAELLLEQEARRAVAAGWPNNETETTGAFVQEPLPL